MKAKNEKDNAKKAKEELKEINKKAKNENVVLSIMCCTQILKKGGTCKQKQHTGTLCLRHHNITIALGAIWYSCYFTILLLKEDIINGFK